MKKIGKWFIPDADLGKEIIIETVKNEGFQCGPVLDEAFKYVKKFDNAIDVGTWIGDSTLIMSKKFKKVIGFEASPVVYECCIKNLENFNIQNTEVIMKGLSNKSGLQKFLNKGKTYSGWISTLPLDEKTDRKSLTVETCKLDDFDFVDIDFIKIDVDSHEGFLVDGSRNFFANNSPVVAIESKYRVHHERQDQTMPDPLAILKTLGYEVVASLGKADYILVKGKI